MDYKKRKRLEKEVTDYLKSDYNCIEHLMGLKVIIQALDVAIDRRLKYLIQQRDKLRIKNNKDNEWLD